MATATTASNAEAIRESLLPLAVVREYTKTDDVPSVTDLVLRLHREAAFDFAAQFVESIDLDPSDMTTETTAWVRGQKRVRLKYPAIDGLVTVTVSGTSVTVVIPAGGQYVVVGSDMRGSDGQPITCCTCANGPSMRFAIDGEQQDITITYRSGNCGAKGVSVPAGVKIAMLQMIDWLIQHPGGGCDSASAARATGAMNTFQIYRTGIGF